MWTKKKFIEYGFSFFFFFFLKITNIRNGDIYRGKDDVIVEQMDRPLSILFSKIEAQIMAR